MPRPAGPASRPRAVGRGRRAGAKDGLAGLAGSAPHIGVVGYTLGGGLGWLGRKYGLAANSVLSAEIVTADGEVRRADSHHEPYDPGRTYFNFTERTVESSALFPPETVRRLRGIKRELDPEDLFFACHPVAPA